MALISNTVIENYMRIREMINKPNAGVMFLKIEGILTQEALQVHARQHRWRWLESEETLTSVAGKVYFALITIETVTSARIDKVSPSHGIYSLIWISEGEYRKMYGEDFAVSDEPRFGWVNQRRIYTHAPPQTSSTIDLFVRGLIDTDSSATILAVMLAGHEVALHTYFDWKLGVNDVKEDDYKRVVERLWNWENQDINLFQRSI